MTISGHVRRVTNIESCYGPILFGDDAPPTQGFDPWAGATVSLVFRCDAPSFFGQIFGWVLLPVDLGGDLSRSVTTGADGSFSFSDPTATQLEQIAAWAGIPGDEALTVELWVAQGQFPFQVMYRSDVSLTLKEADGKELDLWLLPYKLPVKDGISAGMISGVMSGKGLPGNTTITANGSGLSFSGSSSGADVNFGIGITPDTSSDLDAFFDIALTSWNIDVGWPADWCTSADDILHQIQGAVGGAGASVNAKVLALMKGILDKAYPGLQDEVATFIDQDVSVTFINLSYPKPGYSWPASNTKDGTVALLAEPVIGWPRSLASEPTKPSGGRRPRGLFDTAPIHPLFGPPGSH